MKSSVLSRISAALLFVAGAGMLFVPDSILPRVVAGFPLDGAWLGQLLGAAWLGVAALNWLNRSTVLGGIYGRPVVFANLVLYFISTTVLVDVLLEPGAHGGLWLLLAPSAALALAYAFLLLRGPFGAEFGYGAP